MARKCSCICSSLPAHEAALLQPSLTSVRQRRMRGVSSRPGGSHIGSDTFSSACKEEEQ